MDSKVKKYTKRTVGIILFVLLMIFMLTFINQIMIIKRVDGVISMKALYEQEDDTIDVLFVGSSHAGVNLDPEELWNGYGVASFTLWAGMQPFWNTYFNLVEAFKTQSPKVVVLDVFAATFNFDLSDDVRQVMSVGGMKMSKNKLDACKVSAKKEKVWNLFFGLPFYHSRFDELKKEDFEYLPWDNDLESCKGSGVRYPSRNVAVLKNPSTITDVYELNKKEEEYLQKIIDLCKSRSTPLLLIKTPTINREAEQPFYNRVSQIAENNGIPFLNFNTMDAVTGIDPSDYWNDYDYHLNTRGARKISNYLGKLLVENYGVVDRRGDERFDSWNKNATQMQNEYIQAITENDDYFSELKRDDRSVFVVKNLSWQPTLEFLYLINEFQKIGSNVTEFLTNQNCAWFLSSSKGDGSFERKVDGGSNCLFEFEQMNFAVDFSQNKVTLNGKTCCSLTEPGIVCVVFDKNVKKCVDVSVFTLNENFKVRHIDEWKN